jgi:hypothetical protein
MGRSRVPPVAEIVGETLLLVGGEERDTADVLEVLGDCARGGLRLPIHVPPDPRLERLKMLILSCRGPATTDRHSRNGGGAVTRTDIADERALVRRAADPQPGVAIRAPSAS